MVQSRRCEDYARKQLGRAKTNTFSWISLSFRRLGRSYTRFGCKTGFFEPSRTIQNSSTVAKTPADKHRFVFLQGIRRKKRMESGFRPFYRLLFIFQLVFLICCNSLRQRLRAAICVFIHRSSLNLFQVLTTLISIFRKKWMIEWRNQSRFKLINFCPIH